MIAQRCQSIQPFYVMDLLAQAQQLEQQGRDIIHMEVGEPDFTTPQPILDAGLAALRQGQVHYTAALGLPALREAIAGHYQQNYGVTVDPNRIVVTPGSSSGLQLLMHALINPGDHVVLTDPGYPCNKNFVHLVGGQPVYCPLVPENGFHVSLEGLAAVWSNAVKAVMLASPSNPTGAVMALDELQAVVDWVHGRGGHVIVDEIYHGLHYDARIATALATSDNVYVVNSFSKYYSMTGWRLGWLVVPSHEVMWFERLAQNLFLSAPTLAQHAALAAFLPETTTILEARKAQFQQRRDFLVPALRALGLSVAVAPQGAFYVYGKSTAWADDSFAWCTRVLQQAGVAVTPGRDFAVHQAEQYVRFAYTTSIARMAEAVDRLGHFISINR